MIKGNLCVCESCGDTDYYKWTPGEDHFPLVCRSCGKRSVVIFLSPDDTDVSDLDLLRLKHYIDKLDTYFKKPGNQE